MKFSYQRPNPAISDYVRTVVVVDGAGRLTEPRLPLFTKGMPALVYWSSLDERTGNYKIRHLSLALKSSPFDVMDIDETTTIIGYFFHPFSMPALFNVSVHDLNQSDIELVNWNPHKANALRTQLMCAPTSAAKVEVLDHLLISQLKQQKKVCELVKQATEMIMQNSNHEIITNLLTRLNINERTFQRMFKKFVGVTPSHYRRICQFHSSFDQVRSRDFEKLTDVAFENGFADQSHFTRSFKEFTNTTPKDYLKSGLTWKS